MKNEMPHIVMLGWDLSPYALMLYGLLMEGCNFKKPKTYLFDCRPTAEIRHEQKIQRALKELTKIHPKYGKSLIRIENEVIDIVDISGEAEEFMREEYPDLLKKWGMEKNDRN